jgi:hypothetical protein
LEHVSAAERWWLGVFWQPTSSTNPDLRTQPAAAAEREQELSFRSPFALLSLSFRSPFALLSLSFRSPFALLSLSFRTPFDYAFRFSPLEIRIAAGHSRHMKTCRAPFPDARHNSPVSPSRELSASSYYVILVWRQNSAPFSITVRDCVGFTRHCRSPLAALC